MNKDWFLISGAPKPLLTTCDMYQWVRTGCWLVVLTRQCWQIAAGFNEKGLVGG